MLGNCCCHFGFDTYFFQKSGKGEVNPPLTQYYPYLNEAYYKRSKTIIKDHTQ